MYPASGLLFCDGSGVRKTASYKTFEAVFFCSFFGSGDGFHLLEVSFQRILPVGQGCKSVCGKLGLIES